LCNLQNQKIEKFLLKKVKEKLKILLKKAKDNQTTCLNMFPPLEKVQGDFTFAPWNFQGDFTFAPWKVQGDFTFAPWKLQGDFTFAPWKLQGDFTFAPWKLQVDFPKNDKNWRSPPLKFSRG